MKKVHQGIKNSSLFVNYKNCVNFYEIFLKVFSQKLKNDYNLDVETNNLTIV